LVIEYLSAFRWMPCFPLIQVRYMGKVYFGHATHAGCKRDHNEDNYLVDEQLGLWVVADGMGGHECGEVASQIVVDLIHDKIKAELPLKSAIEKAHEIVLLAADQMLGLPGMGSTVVAMKVTGDQFEIAWVGDSRAYLWDENDLELLTRDHSFVQHLVDSGEISSEEALCHPHRNIITQAIGANDLDTVEVDVVYGTLCKNQQILLCSDGLTDEVSEQEIANVFSEPTGEQDKVDKLVQLALDNGGSDNLTVVIVSASENAPEKSGNDATHSIDLN
jgi:protein phosphatase